MCTLPTAMIRVLAPFVALFSERVCQHAQVLLAGAILAPGRRTVAAALRVMGLGHSKQFHRYHRVLNRAKWSGREAARVLSGLLARTFVPDGEPLVIGVDETLERRWGKKKIAAKGTYRDPVRSSHEHFVKASALRWMCLTLLVPIPWAGRVWALPFLGVLAPSERYAEEHGKRHKKLTDWARQSLFLVRRWWPERENRGCGRLRLRGDLAAGPLSTPLEAHRRGNPPAPGCRALRTGPAAPSRPDRTAPSQGRASAHARGRD
jgi:DDE superfamily endonuclease